MQGPSGLPIKNGTLNFGLQQAGLMVGTGSVVPTTASCYTSADGSVVGLPNPLTLPNVSITYGSGTMAARDLLRRVHVLQQRGQSRRWPPRSSGSTHRHRLADYLAAGDVSRQRRRHDGLCGHSERCGDGARQLDWQQRDIRAERDAGDHARSQSRRANTSPCTIAFNDTIIPYSGYNVSLISSSGNAYPGWPQAWQLNGGLSGTVNISNGAPLWNGTIIYPQPILSQPLNHGPQSISGLLNMTGYNLLNMGALGVGTSTPACPVDVENGYINTNLGYLVNGGAGTTGQCLVSNGTFFGPGSCGTLPTIYLPVRPGERHVSCRKSPISTSRPLFARDTMPGSTRTDVDLADYRGHARDRTPTRISRWMPTAG